MISSISMATLLAGCGCTSADTSRRRYSNGPFALECIGGATLLVLCMPCTRLSPRKGRVRANKRLQPTLAKPRAAEACRYAGES